MDETVKIYRAKELAMNTLNGFTIAKFSTPVKDTWEKPKTKLSTLKLVIREKEAETGRLMDKHPWAVIFYNWLVLACILALLISFIVWGVQIHTNEQISIASATALADYQAEQAAKEREAQAVLLAERNSVQAKKDKDIELMAKFLEGLSGFVKNKGYTNVDLYTYGQCPLNRILNPAFWCTTLEEAVRQENQWVGYSENNQVTAANKELATRIINEFYDESTRPCGYEFCWTEFTDNGLYLKSDFGPATFNNTWRAKG